MNKNQVQTVNLVNEMILAPLSIIPTIATRPTKRLYYKDTVTQKRYAVKVENNQFNVREELVSPYTGKAYRFGSRTIFRTINDDKQLAAALSDFKDYVMKHRTWYIKMMNKNFGSAVAAKENK